MLCSALLLGGVGAVLYPGIFTGAFLLQVGGVFIGIVLLDWTLEACLTEGDVEVQSQPFTI